MANRKEMREKKFKESRLSLFQFERHRCSLFSLK